MCRYSQYLTAALLLVLFCGCTAPSRGTSSPSSLASFAAPDAGQISVLRQKAETFTQAMCRSFRTGDFKYWKEALEKESSPGQSLIVNEVRFRQMRDRLSKSWGELVKCHYLGELDQSILRDFIWKCTFESKAADGKVIRLEELFVVRCTLLNGKTAFTGFGFRFFNRPGFRDQVKKQKKAEEKK